MKNIVILLSAMLFMVACEKGNEEMKEAKVVVSVYDENGKIATGVPVKMYNEKDYKVFEKDNLTLPTAIIQTNESGPPKAIRAMSFLILALFWLTVLPLIRKSGRLVIRK